MICAMLLHIAGATEEAIIADYADGWRGAGAYAGHGWVYDPDEQSWRQSRREPVEPRELERQIAERLPALVAWIRAFTSDADDLKALLRG